VQLDQARLSVFGTTVFENGSFHLDGTVERALAEQLRAAQQDEKLVGYPQNRPTVPIRIDFTGRAGTDVTVLGSDLSYEYIRENADYRT
jgi:N-acetylglutamate synthase/N-acetylornithine aminotransferase